MGKHQYTVSDTGFNFRASDFSSKQEFEETYRSLAGSINLELLNGSEFTISFSELYKYRSVSEQSPVVSRQLFLLGVPDYDLVRFEKAHTGRINGTSFKFSISIFNRRQEKIELSEDLGDYFKDRDGRKYFLSEPNALFIRAWNDFSISARDALFNKDMNFRLTAYGKLVSAYDRLELQGTSLLDTFKVRIIDNLDYNLVGNDDGSLDIVPAFGDDLEVFNETINKIVETEVGVSSNLNLNDRKRKKQYKVIFSESATKKWKAFSEIKKLSKEDRTEVIKSGEFLTEFPPKAVVGTIFSDRIAGFILDSPEKAYRDNQQSETWSEGFDDVSNLLHSYSGSAYAIPLDPTPEVYEEIKNKVSELKEQHRVAIEAAKAATGAQFTEPVFDQPLVRIESLKDNFTLKEVEVLVERIEKHNKPIISEVDIDLARRAVSEAAKSGKVTARWILPDGEESEIPTKSLQLAIDELSVSEVRHKSINVKIAASESNEESDINFPDDWFMTANSQKYATATSFKPEISLMPHQVKGYAWLHALATDERIPQVIAGRGGLLADDMGLGKTIQVIRLIESIRTEFQNSEKPILIVGPVSLLKTSWENDGLKKFFKEEFFTKNNIVHMSDVPKVIPKEVILKEVLSFEKEITNSPDTHFGSLQLSDEIAVYLNSIKSMIGNSIVLCSYETLRSRIFELASLDFALFVVDEAQKIKNATTGQSAAAKAIKADIRVAMTGTPIENSISDLWNICDFVSDGFLGSLKDFNEKYAAKIAKTPVGTPERARLAEQLESDLKPIWLRRTKKEVLKSGELPAAIHFDSCKDSNGQVFNKHLVNMSPSQIEVFKTQVGFFNESRSGHKLAAIRNMMEACFAPWWAKGILAEYKNFDKLCDLTPKLKCTFDILTEIAAKDEKVILFVNTLELQRDLANLIHQWYFSTFGKSVDCEVFNGSLSLNERGEVLKRFKAGLGFKAIIISPRSGGAGLNIVEANHVIHYTREWNPAIERQATDRAHRLGQKKEVFVYYPTSSLGHLGQVSAEEHLANILRAKRDVIDDFTISEGELSLNEKSFSAVNFTSDSKILTTEGIATLGPYRFEKLVAKYFEYLGHSVEIVGGAGDVGCDIVTKSPQGNYLIQCKFTEGNAVQHTAGIKEIRGAHSTYENRYGCKFSLVAVTNSIFSPNAHSLAIDGLLVKLIEGNELSDWLKGHKVHLADLR